MYKAVLILLVAFSASSAFSSSYQETERADCGQYKVTDIRIGGHSPEGVTYTRTLVLKSFDKKETVKLEVVDQTSDSTKYEGNSEKFGKVTLDSVWSDYALTYEHIEGKPSIKCVR